MRRRPEDAAVPSSLAQRAASLLRRRTGPLTTELLRRPSEFGLGQVPARLQADEMTTMVCGFCATGCGLDVHLRDGVAVNITPSRSYPVNLGMACPKGWEALAPLAAADRATTPLLRDGTGALRPVDWPTATETFARRMSEIQMLHGRESVAFLSTGQIATEEMALLGAVAKIGMGMVHGDSNTRQCMASAAVAYKETFGFDAPPYSYEDFEQSDVIVLVGSNLCVAHPIMWERICRNPHRPEIVVIDPRRTETAGAATQHLALAPKSDLPLFYGLASLLISNGKVDRDFVERHTVGFEEFASFVSAFDLDRVVAETGLSAAVIERLADTIGRGERVSFWWTMGVNQSHQAVRTAEAIIALALMTGNVGRPGTGANSVTGQCNAMGSRLFSNTSSLFGGRDFADPNHRQAVARIIGVDEELIPATSGATYDQILEMVEGGRIRGLWVIATNTAHSWIDSPRARAALQRLDFLVVQDMYATTETAELADLVLPAAGWGEKEGTFINSERRIGRIKRVSPSPGQALADFSIVKLLAGAWGCGDLFERWSSPEAVFAILQELSAGRPCDITGIAGYDMLDRSGGVQWPCPSGQLTELRAPRLFTDGSFFTPDGRARFVFDEPRSAPTGECSALPLVLLTGRGTSAQWHTLTRTDKSPLLRSLSPPCTSLEMAPCDAAERGISTGDLVEVTSQRASITVPALVTVGMQHGCVFLPMHDALTNSLTHPAFDPHSRQPSYKHARVEVMRCNAGA